MENQIKEELAKLGLSIPKPTIPLGAYVPAVLVQNIVFVSGQLPMIGELIKFRGKLGEDLDLKQGYEAAQICFLNVLSTLEYLGIELHKINKIINLKGYINSSPSFTDHALVLNGASELAHKLFGNKGLHSRLAVGVYSLPKNSCLELEAIIEVNL